MTSQHVVLVGLMGSGKSTVGQRVAEALHRSFVDSDAVIEAATGRTVRDIWLADGEPVFRALETEALRNAGERSVADVAQDVIDSFAVSDRA